MRVRGLQGEGHEGYEGPDRGMNAGKRGITAGLASNFRTKRRRVKEWGGLLWDRIYCSSNENLLRQLPRGGGQIFRAMVKRGLLFGFWKKRLEITFCSV